VAEALHGWLSGGGRRLVVKSFAITRRRHLYSGCLLLHVGEHRSHLLCIICQSQEPEPLSPKVNPERETRNKKRETRDERRETRNKKRGTRNERRETRTILTARKPESKQTKNTAALRYRDSNKKTVTLCLNYVCMMLTLPLFNAIRIGAVPGGWAMDGWAHQLTNGDWKIASLLSSCSSILIKQLSLFYGHLFWLWRGLSNTGYLEVYLSMEHKRWLRHAGSILPSPLWLTFSKARISKPVVHPSHSFVSCQMVGKNLVIAIKNVLKDAQKQVVSVYKGFPYTSIQDMPQAKNTIHF